MIISPHFKLKDEHCPASPALFLKIINHYLIFFYLNFSLFNDDVHETRWHFLFVADNSGDTLLYFRKHNLVWYP